jgi:hypothetical protein
LAGDDAAGRTDRKPTVDADLQQRFLTSRAVKTTRAALAFPWLLVMLGTGFAACTPIHHRLEPYRDDAEAAHALEERAARMCIGQRGAADQPPHPFTTDGCSMWPNGTWTECCIKHDIAYWCGGSAEDRVRADDAFRQCVSESRSACMGTMMYIGVRVGGVPWLPFPWRWGYGWDGISGYDNFSTGKQ